MLTQTDLNAIGKLIDKKIAMDISAIQTRLADLETGRITKIDFISLYNLLTRIEKRMAAFENKLSTMKNE